MLQQKGCETQITWRTSSACLVYDSDRKSILFFTPQVLITCNGKMILQNLKETYNSGTDKLYMFDSGGLTTRCKWKLEITSLSFSVRVGKSIWIWDACKVNNAPANVAEFFIVQTTSCPATSATCVVSSRTRHACRTFFLVFLLMPVYVTRCLI